MPNKPMLLPRRTFLASTAAAVALPLPAWAITEGEARALVDAAVGEVNSVIASGQSEGAMIRQFERILTTYADVPTIARSVLGPPARSASAAQLNAFTQAFSGYFANKWGRRFREFAGGQVTVTGVRQVRSFYEVISTVNIPGQSPFQLNWLVSDGSGRTLFFNLIIEGVNLMISERTEIGAMLEARGGSIDALTAHLRTLG